MFYKPKYFEIQELVDMQTYAKFGNNALMLLNPIALQGIDDLREYINTPLIINNWHTGGSYQFSGFRPMDCTKGAKYSQHRLGNAFDIKPQGMSAGELYNIILENQDHKLLTSIKAMEDISNTPSWVHVDFRNIEDRIRIFKP